MLAVNKKMLVIESPVRSGYLPIFGLTKTLTS
jgi:hypothetical protein